MQAMPRRHTAISVRAPRVGAEKQAARAANKEALLSEDINAAESAQSSDQSDDTTNEASDAASPHSEIILQVDQAATDVNPAPDNGQVAPPAQTDGGTGEETAQLPATTPFRTDAPRRTPLPTMAPPPKDRQPPRPLAMMQVSKPVPRLLPIFLSTRHRIKRLRQPPRGETIPSGAAQGTQGTADIDTEAATTRTAATTAGPAP